MKSVSFEQQDGRVRGGETVRLSSKQWKLLDDHNCGNQNPRRLSLSLCDPHYIRMSDLDLLVSCLRGLLDNFTLMLDLFLMQVESLV